jgi:hypothetical protein
MEEQLLLKIALSCSLAGLVVLYFLTASLELEETKVSNLTGTEESTLVRLMGVVESVEDSGKIMYIDVAQPETASIIIFKDRNLSIAKGDFVDVRGEVRDYKGKKEIVAAGIDVLG